MTCNGCAVQDEQELSPKSDMQLTRSAIQTFADQLGVEYCAIKAVITVETSGKAFLADGRPVILFEGHVFWRELNRLALNAREIYNADRSIRDILYPTWTKEHYKGGAAEYERLNRAIEINREAALRSASWGLFQIMGFNFPLCGCGSVEEFVAAQADINAQLRLAATFLKNAGHVPALITKNWPEFARRYNGPAYAENGYDKKLQKAYEKCLQS